MNKISSLSHAHPASRSWVPWLYSAFGMSWTLVCQQADSHSLQVQPSRAAFTGYSQNFSVDTKLIFSRRIWANSWSSQSLRKRKRRMKHEWTAKGRKTHIGEEETHGIRAVLQCLSSVLNTMKIGGLLRQPFCYPAMFLTEPLSLFIIIITLFMWALYRPQNSTLLHIYFKLAL